MELRQLRYFYAVAKCENFSKAAEELYVAQSALSKSIGKLEDELGIQLFIRTNKNVRLSPAGIELKSYLSTLLPSINEIGSYLHDYIENHVEVCTVSILASMSTISEIIGDYCRSFPSSKLNLTRSVEPGTYDVKFVLGQPDFEQTNTILLRNFELFALVSKKSPLAKYRNLHFADLASYNYLENTSSQSLTTIMKKYISELSPQYKLNPSISVGDNNLLCYMVESDLGYTFTPDMPSLLRRYEISIVPMENHALSCPLYLCWDKNRYLSSAARGFISYACDYYGVTPTGLYLDE